MSTQTARFSGRITQCGEGKENWGVDAFVVLNIGLKTLDKPCEVAVVNRLVGHATTDSSGDYSITYQVPTKTGYECKFLVVKGFIRVLEQGTDAVLRVSPMKSFSKALVFNEEIACPKPQKPLCPDGSEPPLVNPFYSVRGTITGCFDTQRFRVALVAEITRISYTKGEIVAVKVLDRQFRSRLTDANGSFGFYFNWCETIAPLLLKPPLSSFATVRLEISHPRASDILWTAPVDLTTNESFFNISFADVPGICEDFVRADCFCQLKKYPFDNRKMTHLSSFV